MTRKEAVDAIYRVINCDFIEMELESELRAAAAAIEYDEFEPKWIPVSERPPKDFSEVLVTFEMKIENDTLLGTAEADFMCGEWSFKSKIPRTGIVTAWMEKPEPWKGE